VRCEILHSYSICRGFGRVQFAGFVEAPGQSYYFFLTGTGNPLRWPFDVRLYREVEELLLSMGVSGGMKVV
jgi:hypothetical protein